MPFLTNAALYSQTPITGWTAVDRLDLGNGKTAYYLPAGQTAAVASVRRLGVVVPMPADNIGINETFTEHNGLASAVIGEGPFVLAIAE
jgi:hypothetical protein